MDNKTLGAILGGFGAIIIVIAVGFGILIYTDNNEDPAPTPTVTATPTPEPSVSSPDPDQLVFEILEEVWAEQSYRDQQKLCLLFNTYPEQAWLAFDGSSNGYISRDQFMEFFSGKCASIT
jgi:hypothetical protein